MTEFCALRAKAYAFKYDENKVKKKAKGIRKDVTKHNIIVDRCKDGLFKNKTKMATQLTFKSDCHNVCTTKINKTALCSNDDKRLQNI